MELCIYGIMYLWNYVFIELCLYGIMYSWNYLFTELCIYGIMDLTEDGLWFDCSDWFILLMNIRNVND